MTLEKAKNYFESEYGSAHIESVISMNDLTSLYGLIEEYAEHEVKKALQNQREGIKEFLIGEDYEILAEQI
jgi:hypothetical protein